MIGLGTYAFFWQHSDRAPKPLSLIDAFHATRALDVGLFQICDYAPLDAMTDAELRTAAGVARELGLRIQLGTKGISPAHLLRYLRLARIFDADLVRSMIHAPGSRPSPAEARAWLTAAVRAYEEAGVTLALETYEQVATDELVRLVDDVGSAHLGICLDPANVVARLEDPRACVEAAASTTRNVHVKDFAFTRRDGWVGFTYAGAPMGDGLLDYAHLRSVVHPAPRGIDEIVEHWLPWQGDAETTVRTERDWTRTTLEYLRRTP